MAMDLFDTWLVSLLIHPTNILCVQHFIGLVICYSGALLGFSDFCPLNPVVPLKFVCIKGSLCHSFLHTFPLHDPWMIQKPLCLLQIVIHFSWQLYLENPLLSWTTLLDHGWIFITGGWSATLAFFPPWPAQMHEFINCGCGTDGLLVFSDDISIHGSLWKMSFSVTSIIPLPLMVNMKL